MKRQRHDPKLAEKLYAKPEQTCKSELERKAAEAFNRGMRFKSLYKILPLEGCFTSEAHRQRNISLLRDHRVDFELFMKKDLREYYKSVCVVAEHIGEFRDALKVIVDDTCPTCGQWKRKDGDG
jgi:hypothetical protein